MLENKNWSNFHNWENNKAFGISKWDKNTVFGILDKMQLKDFWLWFISQTNLDFSLFKGFIENLLNQALAVCIFIFLYLDKWRTNETTVLLVDLLLHNCWKPIILFPFAETEHFRAHNLSIMCQRSAIGKIFTFLCLSHWLRNCVLRTGNDKSKNCKYPETIHTANIWTKCAVE